MRPIKQILEIQNAIKLNGLTQAAIAERADVTATMVSKVVNGHAVSAKIERAINDAVGRDVFAMGGDSAREGADSGGAGAVSDSQQPASPSVPGGN